MNSKSVEFASNLEITLGEPWGVQHMAGGTIHGIPKFFPLADGSLLYYYQIGGDFLGAGRRCMRSHDLGKTWTPEPVRLPEPSALMFFPDRSVIEFEAIPKTVAPGVFDVPICRSLDGGRSWEAPSTMRMELPGCTRVVLEASPAISLEDGRVLGLVTDYSLNWTGDRRGLDRVLCVVSSDNGHTWQLQGAILSGPQVQTEGVCEPALARLADGSLLAVMRSDAYESHWQARSFDEGATWTEIERITGWGCFPRLSVLSNGILACSSGRPGFFIQFSLDGRGEEWTHHTEVTENGLGGWNNWYWEVAPGEILCTWDKMTRKKSDADEGACTWYMRMMHVQQRQGPPRTIRGRDGKEMLYIPPGMFHFGADYHQVCTGAYYIDKYPVTVAEYKRFLAETGHQPPILNHNKALDEINQNTPIYAISWHDAAAYARWAGKRLPTDAEWEKAARGPNGRLYPWGDEFDPTRAYCMGSPIPWPGATGYPDGGGAIEVDALSPQGDSPYGVSGMAGNVGEWTASDDPHWPGRKIFKGGSFALGPDKARCSWYRSEHPENRHTIGIRCVLDVPKLPK